MPPPITKWWEWVPPAHTSPPRLHQTFRIYRASPRILSRFTPLVNRACCSTFQNVPLSTFNYDTTEHLSSTMTLVWPRYSSPRYEHRFGASPQSCPIFQERVRTIKTTKVNRNAVSIVVERMSIGAVETSTSISCRSPIRAMRRRHAHSVVNNGGRRGRSKYVDSTYDDQHVVTTSSEKSRLSSQFVTKFQRENCTIFGDIRIPI